MMSLVEQVVEELSELAVTREADAELVRLTAFYERMKRLGLAKKSEYELPLIDTVGRTLYHRDVVARVRP